MPSRAEPAVFPAPPLPKEIQIEVTGACNLRCHMCLVRYRPPINKVQGSLSFDTFKSIVDDLPELQVITLQGLGEPLLAPRLFEMIEYAARRNIRTGFNTNGTLLTRDNAKQLVQVGLDWLHVSLDGASESTYESIRDGSDFAKVTSNVRGLVGVMREMGSDKPDLEIVFVAMRRNIDDLRALIRLTADMGVPKLWVQNLSHSFDDTEGAVAYKALSDFTACEALWAEPDDATRALFDDARAVAGECGITLRLPELNMKEPELRREGTPGCDWPWRSAYVTHRGEVQPCCMVMGADRAILGNVTEIGFPSIWSGERYTDFRAALLTDDPPNVCTGCSMYRGVF